MKSRYTLKLVTALSIVVTAAYAETINGIEVVGIGSPGNAGDTTASGTFGAVGYDYKIGQYEITFSQFASSGIGSGNEDYWVSLVGSNAPVTWVTFHEAAMYCNWLTTSNAMIGAYMFNGSGMVTNVDRAAAITAAAGGPVFVLPTEDEWYKAAYYKSGSYSTFASGEGLGNPPIEGVDSMFNSTNVWAATGVGLLEQNDTYDMMGNILEWTEDIWMTDTVTNDWQRALRGGAYIDASAAAFLPTSRDRQNDVFASDYVGFRVAIVPEPGTLSLMGMSTLSLFFTRSIRRRKALGKSLLPIHRERVCDSFCTLEELEQIRRAQEAEDEYLTLNEALHLVWDPVHIRVQMWYNKSNVAFWNWMVKRHDSKRVRRQAFRAAMKKRALSVLDGFLALFMK